MEKFFKIIRIITVSPFMALMLCLLLYFCVPASFQNVGMLILTICLLSVVPALAYPAEKIFGLQRKLDKNSDLRQAQRKMAICFSVISYSCLALLVFLTNSSPILKEMTLTYLFSGALIFVFSIIFNINASGHVCGVVGPIAFLSYSISFYFLFLSFLLIFVVISSLKLKRHSICELIIGGIIPIISFLITIFII